MTAETWEVALVNGAVFETRYPPQERAAGADGKGARLQLLTDVGNWISLDPAIVRSIRAVPETGGFGRVIARGTIDLGISHSALPPATGEATPGESTDPALAFLESFAGVEGLHTVPQFVEPEESLGIPLSYSLGALPPAGSPQRFLTSQDRP